MRTSEEDQLIDALLGESRIDAGARLTALLDLAEPSRSGARDASESDSEARVPSSALSALVSALGQPSEAGPNRSISADRARTEEGDAAQLIAQLLRNLPATTVPEQRSAPRPAEQNDKGGSVTGTILKTLGMATGIGPIAAGLISLFGGGSDEKREPEPVLYDLPESIRLQAGLTRDRRFEQIGYAESGLPREAREESRPAQFKAGTQPAAPTIQVNINALDSRSFLDRSDDIARAVRDAMLHSHSLNDVVSEL
ncbi:MAG TPA: hypothetical protein VEQ63_11875 [Bryobacteraceae bacterium]|nr:hypothetical protein [Bryobacteraceae bacterium]